MAHHSRTSPSLFGRQDRIYASVKENYLVPYARIVESILCRNITDRLRLWLLEALLALLAVLHLVDVALDRPPNKGFSYGAIGGGLLFTCRNVAMAMDRVTYASDAIHCVVLQNGVRILGRFSSLVHLAVRIEYLMCSELIRTLNLLREWTDRPPTERYILRAFLSIVGTWIYALTEVIRIVSAVFNIFYLIPGLAFFVFGMAVDILRPAFVEAVIVLVTENVDFFPVLKSPTSAVMAVLLAILSILSRQLRNKVEILMWKLNLAVHDVEYDVECARKLLRAMPGKDEDAIHAAINIEEGDPLGSLKGAIRYGFFLRRKETETTELLVAFTVESSQKWYTLAPLEVKQDMEEREETEEMMTRIVISEESQFKCWRPECEISLRGLLRKRNSEHKLFVNASHPLYKWMWGYVYLPLAQFAETMMCWEIVDMLRRWSIDLLLVTLASLQMVISYTGKEPNKAFNYAALVGSIFLISHFFALAFDRVTYLEDGTHSNGNIAGMRFVGKYSSVSQLFLIPSLLCSQSIEELLRRISSALDTRERGEDDRLIDYALVALQSIVRGAVEILCFICRLVNVVLLVAWIPLATVLFIIDWVRGEFVEALLVLLAENLDLFPTLGSTKWAIVSMVLCAIMLLLHLLWKQLPLLPWIIDRIGNGQSKRGFRQVAKLLPTVPDSHENAIHAAINVANDEPTESAISAVRFKTVFGAGPDGIVYSKIVFSSGGDPNRLYHVVPVDTAELRSANPQNASNGNRGWGVGKIVGWKLPQYAENSEASDEPLEDSIV